VKTGDLVVATRKEIWPSTDPRNRYFGIFLKEKYGDLFIKWIGDPVSADSALTFGMWRL